MSDSSDEEVCNKPKKGSANRYKRRRLLSETSEHEVVAISDDEEEVAPKSISSSPDEITIIRPGGTNGSANNPIQLNGGNEDDEDEENDLDDEDDESDDEDREDDAIIEGLYDDDDDDDPIKQSSATQKRVKSLKDTVVDFFQTASSVDLESIPGVSKKKVEQLLTLRPIISWEDLNNKIQLHKSSGINEDVVINAVKTIKSRSIVEKLMNDCQKLAKDIGQFVDRLPEAPQPNCIPKEMKLSPYQLVGLNWLVLMHNKGVNGILADEMGLGKTIQVISFIAYLRECLNMHRHHLIIVPASTLDNWEREFDNWCPEIRILQYYGSQEMRAQIRHYVVRNPNEVDVVLTTYNVAQNADDRKLFKKIKFEYLIFDEAHMLKNMKSGRYKSLIKIKSKRRILLTGTPVQNNLVELMSLLVFTMPRMLMSKMSHVETIFSAASKEEGGRTQFERERIDQAKKIMKPFVLRRLKSDVLRHLPKKEESIIRCPLSSTQKKIYCRLVDSIKQEIKEHRDEVLNDDSSFAMDSNDDVKRGAGMLMALRKTSNHPLLMLNHYTKDKLRKMAALMLNEPTHRDANKDLVYEDMCAMHDFELHLLCKQYESIRKFALDNDAILDSGKFKYLNGLLNDLRKKKQRCLLFSQFTMMLDIIEEFLRIKNFEFVRLDGATKVSDRINLIDEFNNNDSITVFLLSTKAGGLGINLTAANIVVIHDIDFNPYNDKQAEDRSHRLGQKNDVQVYKLISEDTVEEGMLDIATEKLKLGENMSEDSKQNSACGTKDMRSLLQISIGII